MDGDPSKGQLTREAPRDECYLTFREHCWRIARRVRPVCTHMPEGEFHELVERMARIEQKYIFYPDPVPRDLRGHSAIWPAPDEV